MSKRIKQLIQQDVANELKGARDVLIVDSSKLDAISDNRFRQALTAMKISALTVRNTLARRVLADNKVSGLEPVLKGPSTLIWGGEDIVSLARELVKWAKDLEKLKIKGAAVEGTVLNAAGVEALSKSPGRRELIGEVVTLALSPGRRVAGAIAGPGGRLAGQIKKKSEESE